MNEVAAPSAEVTGPVAVVRDFVNTSDHELGTDELETAEGLTRWLRSTGLAADAGEASRAELDLARRLRSGLRQALELNHVGDAGSVPALGEALAELPVTLVWDGTAPALTTSGAGVLGGLARVAVAAHQAVASGEWPRLKICAFDECEWAYVDQSKNRSRHYCEYGCGNKLKTRAYRARQRAARA
jgi:predicted RNA-binding Zn ribbon-like protein